MPQRGCELEAADRHCRSLASGHYENFAVAAWFLSARTRTDLARIYAFCRTTDDLGDESGEFALVRLARWRDEVEALFAGGHPVHPVLVALRETVERCSLPRRPFVDLIAANEQDQRVKDYRDWPALSAYCMLSAAPVGRMVLRVFGLREPSLEPLSDDVCVGLQLANFAQDVGRDAAIGRTYLLGDEVALLGIAGATKALCERARSLLESGRTLERVAPAPLRMQLSLYRMGGMAICDAIGRAGYRTDVRRPTVSKAAKAGLFGRALLQVAAGLGARRHVQPA